MADKVFPHEYWFLAETEISCKTVSFQQFCVRSTAKQSTVEPATYQSYEISTSRESWMGIVSCKNASFQQVRMKDIVENWKFIIPTWKIPTRRKISKAINRFVEHAKIRSVFPRCFARTENFLQEHKLSTILRQKYSTAKQSTVEPATYQSYQISTSRESWMALDVSSFSVFEFRFFSYGLTTIAVLLS